jgi:hypothetical protein
MNALPRPLRTAVGGFLAMGVLAMVFTLLKANGVLERSLATRAFGLVVSAMLVMVGNLLPKARGLRSAEAERFTGTVLVLAGSASLLLFALASTSTARHGAGLVWLGALALVAAKWALGAGPVRPAWSARRRRVATMLLFALSYLLVMAGVVFAVDDRATVRAVTPWLTLAFWFGYAVLTARTATVSHD